MLMERVGEKGALVTDNVTLNVISISIDSADHYGIAETLCMRIGNGMIDEYLCRVVVHTQAVMESVARKCESA